ncbi:hypothetical protein C8J57DRAFT_1331701, partial [Mycena rebaudengoi]
ATSILDRQSRHRRARFGDAVMHIARACTPSGLDTSPAARAWEHCAPHPLILGMIRRREKGEKGRVEAEYEEVLVMSLERTRIWRRGCAWDPVTNLDSRKGEIRGMGVIVTDSTSVQRRFRATIWPRYCSAQSAREDSALLPQCSKGFMAERWRAHAGRACRASSRMPHDEYLPAHVHRAEPGTVNEPMGVAVSERRRDALLTAGFRDGSVEIP